MMSDSAVDLLDDIDRALGIPHNHYVDPKHLDELCLYTGWKRQDVIEALKNLSSRELNGLLPLTEASKVVVLANMNDPLFKHDQSRAGILDILLVSSEMITAAA